MAVIVFPVVSEFLLIGCRLQHTAARIALAKKRPVNRACGTASADKILAPELPIKNVVISIPADVSNCMFQDLHGCAAQQEVVEFEAPDGMLPRLQLHRKRLPVKM